MFTTTLPCEVGDVTLGWEEQNDDDVRQIIEKKLAEGFVFFIIPPNDPQQQIRVTKFEQIGDARRVVIPDRDFHELFVQGKLVMVSQPPDTSDTANPAAGPSRAKTSEEVLANNTLAHRPHRGG